MTETHAHHRRPTADAHAEPLALRKFGFWHVTSGLGVIAVGVTMADQLWAVLLVPTSGLWLLLPLAVIAAVPPRAASASLAEANAQGARR